jgi:hypothetical protein
MSIYRTLAVGEIRVIELQPGPNHTPLSCALKHHHLRSEDCRFEALSYCWGDSTDRSIITCNDTPFPVTKSLFGALKALRYEADLRTVWIDAICINQEDIDERNAQVQLMAKIYETAQEVVIWLGEEGGDSSPALELLTNIVAGSKMDYGDKGAVGLKHNLVTAGMVAKDHPAWKSLTAFLCRPWFTRVWVVQEAVMAQKVTVTCGNRRIDWNDLHTAVESIEGIDHGPLIENRHMRIMSLHRYRQ